MGLAASPSLSFVSASYKLKTPQGGESQQLGLSSPGPGAPLPLINSCILDIWGEQREPAPGSRRSPASQGTQIRSAVLRLKAQAPVVPAHRHAARESAAIWRPQLGLASPPGPWPYPPCSVEVLEAGLTD